MLAILRPFPIVFVVFVFIGNVGALVAVLLPVLPVLLLPLLPLLPPFVLVLVLVAVGELVGELVGACVLLLVLDFVLFLLVGELVGVVGAPSIVLSTFITVKLPYLDFMSSDSIELFKSSSFIYLVNSSQNFSLRASLLELGPVVVHEVSNVRTISEEGDVPSPSM